MRNIDGRRKGREGKKRRGREEERIEERRKRRRIGRIVRRGL